MSSSQPLVPPLAVVTTWAERGCRWTPSELANYASEHFSLTILPFSRGFSTLSLERPSERLQIARKDAEDGPEMKRIVHIFEVNNGRIVVAHVRSEPVMTPHGPSVNEYLYVLNMVFEGERWKFGHVVEFKFSVV